MRGRSLLAFAAVLSFGVIVGLNLDRPLRGQAPEATPAAVAQGQVGRYQIAGMGSLLIDTATGRTWAYSSKNDKIEWEELPSPVAGK